MSSKKINQLPLFPGTDTSEVYLVVNDKTETTTYKIKKETLLGTSGNSGNSGTSGISGTSGVNGNVGTSGISGTSGVNGNVGTSGISGTSGVNGSNSGTSGVSGTAGTSGTAQTLTSLTYSAFTELITNSELIKGCFYEINDYETCYDQPDFTATVPITSNNLDVTTGNYKTSGVIQPIIVFATETNEISIDAFQAAYPKDKIQYDWTIAATEVTGNPAKGRIIERIDEFNNRTDYDHRNILFKRYTTYLPNERLPGTLSLFTNGGVIGTDTTFTSLSVGDRIYVEISVSSGSAVRPDLEYMITAIADDTNMTVTGITYIGTFDSYFSTTTSTTGYKRNNTGPSGFTEYYTFDLANVGSRYYLNNYIGNCGNLINFDRLLNSPINNPRPAFYLANNVFMGSSVNNRIGDDSYNNTVVNDCYNNIIAPKFHNNTFQFQFNNNAIGNNFNNNIIKTLFYQNKIGNDFYNNIITSDFLFIENQIGYAFYKNRINCEYFKNNNIANYFRKNYIFVDVNGEFNDNTIGQYFEDNTIAANFNRNSIGGSFDSNNIIFTGGTIDFIDNEILNDFGNNTITVDFQTNKIGGDCKGNMFIRDVNDNGSVSDNNIGYNMAGNEISGYFDINIIGNYFLNNDIFGAFYKNQIGVWFESNVTQDEFAFNVILNDFYNNEIGEYFGFGGSIDRGNVIGNTFEANTIRDHFYDNKISDGFSNNTTPMNFQYNEIKYSVYDYNFATYNKTISTISFNTPTSTQNGNYTGVTYTTNSNGLNASFQVEVGGGVVTGVTIQNYGYDYEVNDIITVPAAQFNGNSDLTITITAISAETMVAGDYNCTISRNRTGSLVISIIDNDGTLYTQTNIDDQYD